MATVFDKMKDFLNKPLPGAKGAQKETTAAEGAAAESEQPPADMAEAQDVQAELLRRDQEIRELQKQLKEEEQRQELEERRRELEELRREYEKEVAAEAQAHAETDDWTYTVQSGDSLWKISERFYGNGARWKEIYEANKDKIENPNLIYPGQTFVIPNVDADE